MCLMTENLTSHLFILKVFNSWITIWLKSSTKNFSRGLEEDRFSVSLSREFGKNEKMLGFRFEFLDGIGFSKH